MNHNFSLHFANSFSSFYIRPNYRILIHVYFNFFFLTSFIMQKRARSDSLTGGTGDVNPQILTFFQGWDIALQVGGNEYISLNFPNPAWELNRSLATPAAKSAFVLEVLKVWLQVDSSAIANNSAISRNRTMVSLVAAPGPIPVPASGALGITAVWEWLLQGTRGVPNPMTQVLACQSKSTTVSNTPNGSPLEDVEWAEIDCTDGDGHGILVGQPIINLLGVVRELALTIQAQNNSIGCRILYRYKGISYDEYVRQFTFGI